MLFHLEREYIDLFFQLQQCKMMGGLESSSLVAASGSPAGMSAACGEGKPAPYKLSLISALQCDGAGVWGAPCQQAVDVVPQGVCPTTDQICLNWHQSQSM